MYKFHHVHVKGPNPSKTADWYIKVFQAKVLREGLLFNAPIVSVEVGGVRINISGLKPDETLPEGNSRQSLGLEHFGLETDNIERDLAYLLSEGAELLGGPYQNEIGATVAYIKAPDNVRIEILQLPTS